jgi:FMN reductase
MKRIRIVGFSGSARRPSRTRLLIETVAAAIGAQRTVEVEIFDLTDAGQGAGVFSRDALPEGAASIIAAIESADGLIIGTPVYKGSYTGLFKHLIDFVEPRALAGKPVILTATGGGHRHALVVEHQLRPLFGFFEARTISTAIYAGEEDFRDGAVGAPAVRRRIADAAGEFDQLLALGEAQHRVASVA